MGVFSRLNQAQKKLDDAENAMPGAYDNSYDQSIQDTLAAMGDQNAAGTGYASASGSYRGALSRLFGNASAGADAATQTAQGLSGGYGADWAQSAANQAAASQTGNTAGTLAQARADALTQWQQELAGQNSQLSTLLGQDQLERTEYDGSVSNAADWRNYLYDKTQQARQEKSDFLSNAWSVVKNLGAAALEGYDAYKGYRQQDWENAFAERQYNDNLSRTQLSDQIAALQQATAYKQAGFDDAASAVLTKYGLDSTMLDAWQGLSQVEQDKLNYLTTAAGLAGSGYDTAAKNYLTTAGLDTGSIDYYDTVSQKQNQSNLNLLAGQLALQNQYKTTGTGGTGTRSTRSSGSSGSSSGSGSSSKSGSGLTNSQLLSISKAYSSMDESDPMYSTYQNQLVDAGWLPRLSGVGNPGKVNGTLAEQGMYQARQMANSGSTQNEIASYLAGTGLSNSQISAIMNQIDYEWRGTK